MASTFDLSGLTINTEEAEEIAKAVFEKVLIIGDISRYHEVQTGIEHDTQIAFVGTLGLVGKKIVGCNRDASGNQIPLTEKKWTPVLIGDRLEHCAVDVNPLLKLFTKAKKINPDFFDRIDSEELGAVLTRLSEAMEQMLDRLIWFGDTAADNVTDGGVWADAYEANLDYYTPIDGLWKQVFNDIPAGSKYHVNIDLNEGADYAAQKNDPEEMDEDYAYKLYRKMINKRDSRFKQTVKKGVTQEIHSTSALVENYVDYLETKSLAFTIDRTEDGEIKEVKYRNTVVVPRYDWDAEISNQDNGTKLNLPHRVLLTTKENIPVGTLSEDDLSTVESFYDQYKKVNVMDFDLKLDVKFLEDYMAVAAY